MHVLVYNNSVEKYPYSINELKKDNPNISFPKNPSAETLMEWGVYPCEMLPTPTYDHLTETVKQNQPSQNENGEWIVTWFIQQLPENQASENIRRKRDELLDESDWTQVADAPVDQSAWATYRQELRDISQQEGFPYNVTWPNKP